jgi:polyphosphate kinase
MKEPLNGKKYINRDLSWIDFNERVLEEGQRRDFLPLDRFRYLSIVASNFDEFFMVRAAAIKRALRHTRDGGQAAGVGDPAGLSCEEQLAEVSRKTRSVFDRLSRTLTGEILPELARLGFPLVRPGEWSPAQAGYLESFFLREVLPLLTPLRVVDDEPLPAVESSWIHAVFFLEREQAAAGPGEENVLPVPGAGGGISIIRIPPVAGRVIWLPPGLPGGEHDKNAWALVDDLVLTWARHLYPGCAIKERFLFKINRDADFPVDEKRDEDFVAAMEEVLDNRERSTAVRMVYSSGSGALKEYLARRLGLAEDDLYRIENPLNPGVVYEELLAHCSAGSGADSLRERPWKIYAAADFPGGSSRPENASETEFPSEGKRQDELSIWESIRAGDAVFHFPYQSFDPVVRFFQEAASDPQIVSIKTALYRTSGNSPLVRALEQAGLAGKHVTAVVELKARFDEERNISWANRLEKAGVIVVYGLARLKVHAKVSLVLRRENGRILRYVHLSTGNYNDRTARLYEDLCLFTCNEEIAYDAGLLFNMLTGYSAAQTMRRLCIAPTGLKARLLELIDREIRRLGAGAPGRITAKMNALADTEIIDALYRASAAGVTVSLNVRGICMLIPGVPGLSENITVVSVVDHYLEHARIFCFANGGADEVYLSSADWMPRNLERRVELMFPVLEDGCKRLVRDILDDYFRDNSQAWRMNADGSWSRRKPAPGEEPFRVQERLLARAANAADHTGTARSDFIVRRSPW